MNAIRAFQRRWMSWCFGGIAWLVLVCPTVGWAGDDSTAGDSRAATATPDVSDSVEPSAEAADGSDAEAAAQESELPDLHLRGTDVTAEALSQLAGRDWGTVSLTEAEFTGAMFAQLRPASSIQSLRLSGEGIHHQIPRLRHVVGLKSLEIRDQLTVRDLEAIGWLTQLHSLTLPSRLTINVTGAREIARLTNLRSLSLGGVDIDDTAFAELTTLVHLRELSLSSTRVTDQGLQVLEHMPRLKKLNLRRHPKWFLTQQVSDACVPVLAQLTELETLWLSGEITDDGLERIAKLPQLKTLWVVEAQITGRGLVAQKESNVEHLMLSASQVWFYQNYLATPRDKNFVLNPRPNDENRQEWAALKSVTVFGGAGSMKFAEVQQMFPGVGIGWND